MLDQVLQVVIGHRRRPSLESARNFLREKHPDNSPILVFLEGFNIKVCFGCKKQFDSEDEGPST